MSKRPLPQACLNEADSSKHKKRKRRNDSITQQQNLIRCIETRKKTSKEDPLILLLRRNTQSKQQLYHQKSDALSNILKTQCSIKSTDINRKDESDLINLLTTQKFMSAKLCKFTQNKQLRAKEELNDTLSTMTQTKRKKKLRSKKHFDLTVSILSRERLEEEKSHQTKQKKQIMIDADNIPTLIRQMKQFQYKTQAKNELDMNPEMETMIHAQNIATLVTEEVKYVAIPPTMKSINIGDGKYNCVNHKESDLAIRYYWVCNYPGCKARFKTLLCKKAKQRDWATYGYVIIEGKENMFKHTKPHPPSWTKVKATKEWLVNQLILYNLSNVDIKVRANIKNAILDLPYEASLFENINSLCDRLYKAREIFHPKLPKSFAELHTMCTDTKYGNTFHQRKKDEFGLVQDEEKQNGPTSKLMNRLVSNHNKPYHVNHSSDTTIQEMNDIYFQITKLKAKLHTLSVRRQLKLNKLWLGSLYLGRTEEGDFIFQSPHATLRMQHCKRINLDGTFPKIAISANSKNNLGQYPWSQLLIFSTHHYSPVPTRTSMALECILVFTRTKKKENYKKIAERIIELNQQRLAIQNQKFTLQITDIGLDFEKGFEIFSKIWGIPRELGCLYHFNMVVFRRIQKNGLVTLYLSNATFRLQLKIYFACCWLHIEQIETFLEQQKIVVQKTLNGVKGKRKYLLSLGRLFKSFKKSYVNSKATYKKQKWNMLHRLKGDETQNASENINRWIQNDMASDRSCFSCIDAWARRDAIASFKYDTLLQHGVDNDKCYNRATNLSTYRKELLANFRKHYLLIKDETFQDQTSYLSNIVLTFASTYPDQHLKQSDLILNTADETLFKQQENNFWYTNKNRIANFFDLKHECYRQWIEGDINDQKHCQKLSESILINKQWQYLRNKYKFTLDSPKIAHNRDTPLYLRPYHETYWGEKLDGAFIGFKPKGKYTFYPGVIMLGNYHGENTVLSIFTPFGSKDNKNLHYDAYNICDILFKLL